jgi:tetratricopeptide (TPR) repeat protein
MILLALVTTALARAPEALEAAWADEQPFRVRNEAIRRFELGDYEGASDRFEFLEAQGALGPEPTYYRGLVAELREDFENAIEHYARVVARWPDTDHAHDARFRRALCLEDLGRHEESLAEVRFLIARGAWSDADRVSLEIEQRVNLLEIHASEKNERRLAETLAEADALGELTWLRAKARAALAESALDRASGIRLRGNAKAARRLNERTALMGAAEKRIVEIAQLDEPQFVLESLVRMGDAYLELHDAMLEAPPPPRFGPRKSAIYEAAVEEKVTVLRTKAWRYYDEGLQLALRIGWVGHATDQLRARRDAVDLLAVGPDGPTGT